MEPKTVGVPAVCSRHSFRTCLLSEHKAHGALSGMVKPWIIQLFKVMTVLHIFLTD